LDYIKIFAFFAKIFSKLIFLSMMPVARRLDLSKRFL